MADLVDDLHSAEDRVGELEAAAKLVVDTWEGGDLAEAVTGLAAAIETEWMRPSCVDGECSEDCDGPNCPRQDQEEQPDADR